MTKCETRKQLSYSRLGTGIFQENGGSNQVLRRVKPSTCMTVVNTSIILTKKNGEVGGAIKRDKWLKPFEIGYQRRLKKTHWVSFAVINISNVAASDMNSNWKHKFTFPPFSRGEVCRPANPAWIELRVMYVRSTVNNGQTCKMGYNLSKLLY